MTQLQILQVKCWLLQIPEGLQEPACHPSFSVLQM